MGLPRGPLGRRAGWARTEQGSSTPAWKQVDQTSGPKRIPKERLPRRREVGKGPERPTQVLVCQPQTGVR